MSTSGRLPVGKLPTTLLGEIIDSAPCNDPDVILGPGIGMDCAVVRHGQRLLVLKADPITFATDQLGHYLVHVNCNDLATTGATPRWMLITLLLPEGSASAELARRLNAQIASVCRELDIALVGGHTEVTYGLQRPIASGFMIGEVDEQDLVTPLGARPGDRLLLTKGVPVEGAALLAREFRQQLLPALGAEKLQQAADLLNTPGISVLKDARIACRAGRVTAMHDPTEGGLRGALWELAAASGHGLRVAPSRVPVPPAAERVCEELGADPLATLASGALLMSVAARDRESIINALQGAGITCRDIGGVVDGPPQVRMELSDEPFAGAGRDEVARLFEQAAQSR